MTTNAHLVLDSVLRIVRPLLRLLLRHGVTYTAFSAALKREFVDAARHELAARQMPRTDSAVSLLSGVHRRDVRNLTRLAPAHEAPVREPLGLAAQVVARWMHAPAFHDATGHPRKLARSGDASSFDALVASVSSDVRPRAVLDELLRLGAVVADDAGLSLAADGFAPRRELQEMLALFSANLHDHLAAGVGNLHGDVNFLEQAVFVDQITAVSAEQLHRVSVEAWKQAFQAVMAQAQERFDDDARAAPAEQRTHRARFGVYFFSDRVDRP